MSATAPTDVNGDDRFIYYGVNVPDATKIQAGEYKISLVYTATAKIPPAPILQSVTPGNYVVDTGYVKAIKVKLTGNNLSTVTQVFFDFNGNGKFNNGDRSCFDPIATNDGEVTCRVEGTYYSPIKSGRYDVYIETQGGTAKLEKAFVFDK